MKTLLSIFLAPFVVLSIKEDDKITLPGLTFTPNFNTYAGYLNANNDSTWQMHYLLTESKSNPDTDPLLLWFNGGPGCASLGGMFEELGPFYVNQDGATLYENVYSWNAKANVLALDSPIGVGFSYSTQNQNFTDANDMQTANQNYAALKDFFSRVQPKYANRTFFLSGESYAGIYIPMLSKLLVQGINSGDFPNKNFQGAAIGNGFMHVQHLMNSLVLWSAYHGGISQDQWDLAKTECRTGGETDHDRYNYQQFMISTNGMDYFADNSTCGQLISQLITQTPAGPNIDFDQYNYYQDCYILNGNQVNPRKRSLSDVQGSTNTAQLTNYESVDNQWGYPCDNGGLTRKYFRRSEVLDAMKVSKQWRGYYNGTNFYSGCNNPMYDLYNLTYSNTQEFFDYVIQNNKLANFRFLIYNGDVDTVCNYLGDSWFIRDVAKNQDNNLTAQTDRLPWLFGQQLSGFVQRYTGKITIDVLTVKGAGHFVPNDRPGPSLQMITNFMFPVENSAVKQYSSEANVPSKPSLLPFVAAKTQNKGGFTANYFFVHTLAVFVYLLTKL